jgi:hypothetical protein
VQVRSALVLLLIAAVAVPVAVAGTAPKTLQARLTAVAPARGGSGQFTATALQGKSSVQLKWHLSVSHLSGPPTAATLRISGGHGLAFPLCKPCGANGRGSLGIVAGLWKQVSGGQGVIVVSTRAHPTGEVRGTLTVG